MARSEGTAPGTAETKRVFARVGGRISRDTVIYVIGSMAVFPFSLVQVAVLTRYLEPSQYGQLAILLTTAGLMTVLMNIVTISGTLRRTFGFADEDDADGDGEVDVVIDQPLTAEEHIAHTTAEKRRSLTTGLVMTLGQITLIGAPVFVFAPQVAGVLIHDGDSADLVRLLCASAAAGALFRFSHNVLRLERRPIVFNILWASRPALVVGFAAWFVIDGHGIAGALMGTVLGTLASVPVALVLTRRLYGLKVSFREARLIVRMGLPRAGMIIGMYMVQNLDTLLLSRYASNSEVGLYRVASRIASIPSYFVSAYLMAQLPLERTTLFRAAYDREGTQRARSLMLTYYMVIALSIVVLLSLASDLLIQIAAPAYHRAADLIPLLALAHLSYGTFIAVLRLAPVAHGRIARVVLAGGAVLIMAAIYPVLVPWLGSYGAALGNIIAMGAVTGVVFWLGSRRDDPIRPHWWRVIKAFAVAFGCWAVATRIADAGGVVRPIIDTAALLAFPGLLVLTGAVPRSHVRVLRDIARSMWWDATGRQPMPGRLSDLSPRRRAVIEAIARDRKSITDVALAERTSEEDVAIRLTRGLRSLSGGDAAPDPADAEIGRYLLATDPNAVRDTLAHRLMDEGIDPLDLHALDETLTTLRRREAIWIAHDGAERR